MKFWRLTSPDYESDYESFYINGSLDHPFTLPGIICDICGEIWGGSRILPYECPRSLRSNQFLANHGPIHRRKFENLQRKVVTELKTQSVEVNQFLPGDALQPCYLEIPSKPNADFLWASLGSLVVSERVKNTLMEHCAGDISCCEVVLGNVGKRESNSPPLVPKTGEPGDIIDEVELLPSSPTSLGPYYEVCIMNESKLSPGCETTSVCSGCGRVEFDESEREICMTENMWRGNQIFLLATTLYIVVSDGLKEAIESLKPTNVAFSAVGQWDKVVKTQ